MYFNFNLIRSALVCQQCKGLLLRHKGHSHHKATRASSMEKSRGRCAWPEALTRAFILAKLSDPEGQSTLTQTFCSSDHGQRVVASSPCVAPLVHPIIHVSCQRSEHPLTKRTEAPNPPAWSVCCCYFESLHNTV